MEEEQVAGGGEREREETAGVVKGHCLIEHAEPEILFLKYNGDSIR